MSALPADVIEIDRRLFELRRGGVRIRLEPRNFALLAYLVQHRARVVSKQEILGELWQERAVSEASVSVAISSIRRAFGDSARSPAVIATHPGRGYRFIGRLACDLPRAPATATDPGWRDGAGASALVGRSRPLAIARERLVEASRGAAQLLLVHGPPGSGKTSFLAEVRRIAEEMGSTAVAGAVSELAPRCGGLPGWPWRQVSQDLQCATRDADGARFAAPENDGWPPAGGTIVDPAFFEATTQALRRVARTRLLVIAFDDVHRFDADSLALLVFALRELRDLPLCIVATHCEIPRDTPQQRRAALAALLRWPGATSIRLEPLSKRDTHAIFAATVGRLPTSDELDWLLGESGGLPLYLHPLCQLLAESRDRIASGRSLASLPIPHALRDAALDHVQCVSLPSYEMLRHAALVGGSFSLPFLVEACGLALEPAGRALDEAARAELLHCESVDASSKRSWRFVHGILRRVLTETWSEAGRWRMHARIAAALETRAEQDPSRHALALAHHQRAAGPLAAPERSYVASRRAARVAVRQGRFARAALEVEHALGIGGGAPPGGSAQRGNLLLELGSLRMRAGEAARARAAFLEAAELAREGGDLDTLAAAALALVPTPLTAEAGFVDPELVSVLEDALARIAGRNDDHEAHLAARLALALQWLEPDGGRRLRLVERARTLAEPAVQDATRGAVWHARWFCEWHPYGGDQRAVIAEQMRSCADASGDRVMKLAAALLGLVDLLERGDTSAADLASRRFLQTCDESSEPIGSWLSPAWRAMRKLLDGELSAAQQLGERALVAGTRAGHANATHHALAQRLLIAWERGEIGAFVGEHERFLGRYPALSAWQAARCWALAKAGHPTRARTVFRSLAKNGFEEIPHRADWPALVAFAAEAACELRELAAVRTLAEQLQPLADRFLLVGLGAAHLGSTHRWLAKLYEALGDERQTPHHFEAAIEANEAAGALLWAIRCRVELADHHARLTRRGVRARAHALLGEARELMAELELPQLRAHADAVAAKIGSPSRRIESTARRSCENISRPFLRSASRRALGSARAAAARSEAMFTIAPHAEKDPDRPAVIYGSGEFVESYGVLEERSRRIGHALRRFGLEPGDCVAVLLGNDDAFFDVFWACHRIGLYFTPVNWHLQRDEVEYIVENCDAKAFVAQARFAEIAEKVAAAVPRASVRVSVGGDIAGFVPLEDATADLPDAPLGEELEGSVMLYSSGTTGRPKGVRRPLSRVQAGDAVAAIGIVGLTGLFGMKAGDVYLSPAPLYHAAPLIFAQAQHRIGATTVILRRFDAREALQAIQDQRVTTSQWVPTHFKRLLSLPADERARYDVSSLRVAVHAAAPCPIPVKEAMIDWWGDAVIEYYAGTEGGGTLIRAEDWKTHKGSVGRHWSGGKIHILDEDGREIDEPNREGAVYFEAPEHAEARFNYYKDEEKTRGTYRGNLFTIGDIGYLDEDGYLYLTDRQSNMIISGGVNIYPQETESHLVTHPKVYDVAVLGVPNEEMGEEVKAVVVPAPGHEPGEALERELIEFCRAHIAHYKCPRTIDFVESLPRTETGKMQKRKLRDRYWEGRGGRIG